MARRKQSAADFIERYDGEMRIILGELVENAGKLNMLWVFARNAAGHDSDRAMTLLIEAQILLEHHLKIERSDSLRRIRAAIDRLDREPPDEEDSDAPAGSLGFPAR
jgi:hypothetical protein